MTRKYIQFYDLDGFQILGSDGIFWYDNRLSNENALRLANKLPNIRDSLKYAGYARIMQCAENYNGAVDQCITEIRYLDNVNRDRRL